MLFASDDEIRRLQRAAATKLTASSDEVARRTVEDARELRSHARLRYAGVMLFVLPAVSVLLNIAITTVVEMLRAP